MRNIQILTASSALILGIVGAFTSVKAEKARTTTGYILVGTVCQPLTGTVPCFTSINGNTCKTTAGKTLFTSKCKVKLHTIA